MSQNYQPAELQGSKNLHQISLHQKCKGSIFCSMKAKIFASSSPQNQFCWNPWNISLKKFHLKKLFNFSKVVFDDEEAEIYFCFSFEKKGVEGWLKFEAKSSQGVWAQITYFETTAMCDIISESNPCNRLREGLIRNWAKNFQIVQSSVDRHSLQGAVKKP